MIPKEPLPNGWQPGRDLGHDDSAALDSILFPKKQPDGTLPARWSSIRNEQTGEQAWLRIQGSTSAAITGVAFTASSSDERINNRSLRSIPLAAIELAIQEDHQRRRRNLDHRLLSPGDEWNPGDPLGNPREVENFYNRVALQFLNLKQQGVERPVAQMADISKRPIKTVQGWVTEARKRGLLPPGKPGRAG